MESQACYACGSLNVKTKYIADGATISISSPKRIETEFIYSSEYDYCFVLTAKKEHLKLNCNSCGYEGRQGITVHRL